MLTASDSSLPSSGVLYPTFSFYDIVKIGGALTIFGVDKKHSVFIKTRPVKNSLCLPYVIHLRPADSYKKVLTLRFAYANMISIN